MIDWYYFLIHGKESDIVPHFDFVFSLKEGVQPKVCLDLLPPYCLSPNPLVGFGQTISGIDTSRLKNEDIREAWRIIGKQSEWIIDMVHIYKDGDIPIRQFTQFMHFFMNAMGVGMQSTLLLPEPITF
jgi:hypothetical protein